MSAELCHQGIVAVAFHGIRSSDSNFEQCGGSEVQERCRLCTTQPGVFDHLLLVDLICETQIRHSSALIF